MNTPHAQIANHFSKSNLKREENQIWEEEKETNRDNVTLSSSIANDVIFLFIGTWTIQFFQVLDDCGLKALWYNQVTNEIWTAKF